MTPKYVACVAIVVTAALWFLIVLVLAIVGPVIRRRRQDSEELLSLALDRANKIIGQQADEMKALSDQLAEFEWMNGTAPERAPVLVTVVDKGSKPRVCEASWYMPCNDATHGEWLMAGGPRGPELVTGWMPFPKPRVVLATKE